MGAALDVVSILGAVGSSWEVGRCIEVGSSTGCGEHFVGLEGNQDQGSVTDF